MSTERAARGDLPVHLVETFHAGPRARALDPGIRRHPTIAACAGLPLDELWLVLAPRSGAGRPVALADLLARALAAAAALERPAQAFLVLVGAGDPEAEPAITAFTAWAAAREIPARIVQTPPIVDDADVGLETSDQGGVMGFLAALHAVKRELDERAAGYFDDRSIRSPVAPGALLPLARSERAAREAVAARDDEGTAPRHVAPDAVVSVSELCEVAAAVYGAAVLPGAAEAELTAIDRLFAGYARGFADRAASDGDGDGDAPRLEGSALEALVEAIRRRQDDLLGRERGRAAGILDELERHTVERPGASLTYLAAGAGERLFLLNALGQRLRFWTRLIARLAERHRVVIWEPRGLDEDAPVSLEDQVGDVEAVARAEGVEGADRVGLVAWCTGPKVAIEYQLRNPGAVSGIVMLNASFKCEGSPEELDTDYDHAFAPICHTLVRRPALAASLVGSLVGSLGAAGAPGAGADPSFDLEGDALAAAVLATVNRDLRAEVRAPFRTALTLARYARQVHDFWSHDARPSAPRVTAPVLLIASQHDRVASPESSRQAAGLFPRGELVALEGATHYCLYDSPELIGELVEDFMERCA